MHESETSRWPVLEGGKRLHRYCRMPAPPPLAPLPSALFPSSSVVHWLYTHSFSALTTLHVEIEFTGSHQRADLLYLLDSGRSLEPDSLGPSGGQTGHGGQRVETKNTKHGHTMSVMGQLNSFISAASFSAIILSCSFFGHFVFEC